MFIKFKPIITKNNTHYCVIKTSENFYLQVENRINKFQIKSQTPYSLGHQTLLKTQEILRLMDSIIFKMYIHLIRKKKKFFYEIYEQYCIKIFLNLFYPDMSYVFFSISI